MDPILREIAHISLALLFAGSSYSKARDLRRFSAVVADYRLVPKRIVPAAAWVFVSIEFGLMLTLLIPAVARFAAVGAGAVLGIYSFAIAINLARGRREIACGCGGEADTMLNGGLLARNIMLIAIASLSALPVATRSFVWFDAMTLVFGVVTVVLAWRAASRLASVPTPIRSQAFVSSSFPSSPFVSQQGEPLHD